MRNMLRKMKPNRFEDIVDAIALYRPGPMENIPAYLKGREDVDPRSQFPSAKGGSFKFVFLKSVPNNQQ